MSVARTTPQTAPEELARRPGRRRAPATFWIGVPLIIGAGLYTLRA